MGWLVGHCLRVTLYTMAEGKRSFIFYADWVDTFKELPKDQGYDLLMHLLAYVNDENPTTDSVLIKAVFANMKNRLKDDLVKWEDRAERSRANGSKGGRPKNPEKPKKPSGLNDNPEEPRKPDSVNDSVSVNAIVNDILLEKEAKELFNEWIEYREELRKPMKTDRAKKSLAKKIVLEGIQRSREVIKHSMENEYQGLFWDRHSSSKPNGNGVITDYTKIDYSK